MESVDAERYHRTPWGLTRTNTKNDSRNHRKSTKMVTRIHEKAMKIEATSWTRPGTEKGARIRMEKVFLGRKIN